MELLFSFRSKQKISHTQKKNRQQNYWFNSSLQFDRIHYLHIFFFLFSSVEQFVCFTFLSRQHWTSVRINGFDFFFFYQNWSEYYLFIFFQFVLDFKSNPIKSEQIKTIISNHNALNAETKLLLTLTANRFWYSAIHTICFIFLLFKRNSNPNGNCQMIKKNFFFVVC